MSDEHTPEGGFDLDQILGLLAPVAEFVSPYVDAVADAAPEARVHLIKSARELCLAVEGFLGALEDAAESVADAHGAERAATTTPDIAVVPDADAADDSAARSA